MPGCRGQRLAILRHLPATGKDPRHTLRGSWSHLDVVLTGAGFRRWASPTGATGDMKAALPISGPRPWVTPLESAGGQDSSLPRWLLPPDPMHTEKAAHGTSSTAWDARPPWALATFPPHCPGHSTACRSWGGRPFEGSPFPQPCWWGPPAAHTEVKVSLCVCFLFFLCFLTTLPEL